MKAQSVRLNGFVTRICLVLALVLTGNNSFARTIYSERYKFKIEIPYQMIEVSDNPQGAPTNIFYDTVTKIVMIISARDAKFTSVDDYLNCTNEKLEESLKKDYGDSTLKILSCNKSPYYPKEITILHFQVSILPSGYDANIIYFIHHRGKDLQISFTYKTKDQNAMSSIQAIIKTLELD